MTTSTLKFNLLEKLILFFCLYLPFQIALSPTEGIDLASGRVFIILIFLIWIIIGLKNKKLIIPFSLTSLLILLFLFLNSLSILNAYYPEWSMRKLLFLYSIFPIYFVVGSLVKNNPNLINQIVKYLVWGSFGVSIVAIFQFSLQFIIGLENSLELWGKYVTPLFLGQSFSEAVLTHPSWLVNLGGYTIFRAISVFPDPHMLAFYTGMTWPFCDRGITRHTPGTALHAPGAARKIIYLVILFTVISANLLTFSRGGYLGLLAGLGILFFINLIKARRDEALPRLYIKKHLKKVFIILIILVLAVYFSPIKNRLLSSFDLYEGSNQGRLQTWGQAVDIVGKNPFLGVGIGNYASEIKPSADYREPIYAHNLYLDIVAEAGLITGLVWVMIILSAIYYFWKPYIVETRQCLVSTGNIYIISLTIFSIHSLFETALYSVRILPLLLIILAMANVKSRDAKSFVSTNNKNRHN